MNKKEHVIVFQFLIGRLITWFSNEDFLAMLEFQFLIGRLITFRRGLNENIERRFQFLIGSLITLLLCPSHLLPSHVSIPHR